MLDGKGEGRDQHSVQEISQPSENPSTMCRAKTRLLLGHDQHRKSDSTVQIGPESVFFEFKCKYVSRDCTEAGTGVRLTVLLNSLRSVHLPSLLSRVHMCFRDGRLVSWLRGRQKNVTLPISTSSINLLKLLAHL